MKNSKFKKILSIILALIVVFGTIPTSILPVSAADNADGSGGSDGSDTSAGTYNTADGMWKVSVYVALNDTTNAETSGSKKSLTTSNWTQYGDTIYLSRSNNTRMNGRLSNSIFFWGDKVDLMKQSTSASKVSLTPALYNAVKPYILYDDSAPYIPINGYNTIAGVKGYFNKAGNFFNILQKIAAINTGKSKSEIDTVAELLAPIANKTVTIDGVSKQVYRSNGTSANAWHNSSGSTTKDFNKKSISLSPFSGSGGASTAAVDWLVVYEPVIQVNPVGTVGGKNYVCATPTELAVLHATDSVNLSGLNKFAYRTFPSSVYLEKSWLGYKKGYDLSSNTTADTVLSTFGWGMRHTAGSNKSDPPSKYTLVDYTAKVTANKTQMRKGDTVTLTYTIKNNTTNVKTIPVYIGAKYTYNGTEYRYDLSEGKDGGVITLNQSNYIKNSSNKRLTGNSALKEQYNDDEYIKVSVRAKGTYTFSIKVKLGEGFVNNQNINFTVYANWWDGVKYPYLREINTGDNSSYTSIKVLDEPKTEPIIKINLVDKSGTESVKGKKFAVWMYSYTNQGVTKVLPSTSAAQQSFVGIITTDANGVGELNLANISSSTGTQYDATNKQWESANGTAVSSLWGGDFNGNVITYSNGNSYYATDASGRYETNRVFSTLFGKSISQYDTLAEQYGALLNSQGTFATASSKKNYVRFVVRPITNIGSDTNPLYYYRSNYKWDVYGNVDANGNKLSTQKCLAASNVKYAVSDDLYKLPSANAKQNFIPFSSTAQVPSFNTIYSTHQNSSGKYDTQIYQDFWYPTFSEGGSTVAETTIYIEPTRGSVTIDVTEGYGYENAPLTQQPFILVDSNGYARLGKTNNNSTYTFKNVPVGDYNVFPAIPGDFNLDGSMNVADLDISTDTLPYSTAINNLLLDYNRDGIVGWNLSDNASAEESLDAGINLYYYLTVAFYDTNNDGVIDDLDHKVAQSWDDVTTTHYLEMGDTISSLGVFDEEFVYSEALNTLKTKFPNDTTTVTAIVKGAYNEQCLATGEQAVGMTEREKTIWNNYSTAVNNDFRTSFAYRRYETYTGWCNAIEDIDTVEFKFGNLTPPTLVEEGGKEYDLNISLSDVYDLEHYYEPMNPDGQVVYRYTEYTGSLLDDTVIRTALHTGDLKAAGKNSHTFEVCKKVDKKLAPNLTINVVDETGDSLSLWRHEFDIALSNGRVAGQEYNFATKTNVIDSVSTNTNGTIKYEFTNNLDTKGKHALYSKIKSKLEAGTYPVRKFYADIFSPTSSGTPKLWDVNIYGQYVHNEMGIVIIPRTSLDSQYYYVYGSEEVVVDDYNNPNCSVTYTSQDMPEGSTYSKTVTITIKKRPGTVRVNLEKASGYSLGEDGLIRNFVLVDSENNVYEGTTVLTTDKESSYVEFNNVVSGNFRVVPFIYGDSNFDSQIDNTDIEIITGYAEESTDATANIAIPEIKASDLNQDGIVNTKDVKMVTGLVDGTLKAIVDGEGNVLVSDVYENNHVFLPMNSSGYQLASGLFTSVQSGSVAPLETATVTFSIGSVSTGSILVQLIKTDKCWNGNIANQEVLLYNNGTLVSKQKTNKNGEVLFSNLMTVDDTTFELALSSSGDSCHTWSWNDSNNVVTKADLDAAGKDPVIRKATLDTPCTGTIKVTATRKGNTVLVYSYSPEYDIIGVKEDGSTVIINHLTLDSDNGEGVSGKSAYKEATGIAINATSEYVAYRIKANPESKKYIGTTYDNVFANSSVGTYNNDGKYLEITTKELRTHNHIVNVDYVITEPGELNIDIVKDNSIATKDSLNNIAKNIGVDLDVKEDKDSSYTDMYSDNGKTDYQFIVGPTKNAVIENNRYPKYKITADDSNLQYPYYITNQKTFTDQEVLEEESKTFTYKVGAYGTVNVKLTKDISAWLGDTSGVQVALYRGSTLLETLTTDNKGQCVFDYININSDYKFSIKVLDDAPNCHEWEEITTFTSEAFKDEYANGYEIDVEIGLKSPCKAQYIVSFVKEDNKGNLVPAPADLTSKLYLTFTDNEGKSYGNLVTVDSSTGKYIFSVPIDSSVTATDYTLTTDFSLLPERYAITQSADANLNPTLVEFRTHDHIIEVIYKIYIPPEGDGSVKVTLDRDVSVHKNDSLTKFKVQLVDTDNFVVPDAKYVDENGEALFEDVPKGEYTAKFVEYDTPPYNIFHTTSEGEKIEEPQFTVGENEQVTVPFIVYAKGTINVTLTEDETSWMNDLKGQNITANNNGVAYSGETDENGFVSITDISLDPSEYESNTFEISGILTNECHSYTNIEDVTIEAIKENFANSYVIERSSIIYTPCAGTINITLEGYRNALTGEITDLEAITGTYSTIKFYLKDNSGKIVSDIVEIGDDGVLSFNVTVNGTATYTTLYLHSDCSEASYKIVRTDEDTLKNPSFKLEDMREHPHTENITYVLEDIDGTIILELTQHEQTWLSDYEYEAVMTNENGEEVDKKTFTADDVLGASPYQCIFNDIKCTEDMTYSFHINKISATGEVQKCHDWSAIEDVTTLEMRNSKKYTVTRSSEINTPCEGQIVINVIDLVGDIDVSGKEFTVTIYAYDKNGNILYDDDACFEKNDGNIYKVSYDETTGRYLYNDDEKGNYSLRTVQTKENNTTWYKFTPSYSYISQNVYSTDTNGQIIISDVLINEKISSIEMINVEYKEKVDAVIAYYDILANITYENRPAYYKYVIEPVDKPTVDSDGYSYYDENDVIVNSVWDAETISFTTKDMRLLKHDENGIHTKNVNFAISDTTEFYGKINLRHIADDMMYHNSDWTEYDTGTGWFVSFVNTETNEEIYGYSYKWNSSSKEWEYKELSKASCSYVNYEYVDEIYLPFGEYEIKLEKYGHSSNYYIKNIEGKKISFSIKNLEQDIIITESVKYTVLYEVEDWTSGELFINNFDQTMFIDETATDNIADILHCDVCDSDITPNNVSNLKFVYKNNKLGVYCPTKYQDDNTCGNFIEFGDNWYANDYYCPDCGEHLQQSWDYYDENFNENSSEEFELRLIAYCESCDEEKSVKNPTTDYYHLSFTSLEYYLPDNQTSVDNAPEFYLNAIYPFETYKLSDYVTIKYVDEYNYTGDTDCYSSSFNTLTQQDFYDIYNQNGDYIVTTYVGLFDKTFPVKINLISDGTLHEDDDEKFIFELHGNDYQIPYGNVEDEDGSTYIALQQGQSFTANVVAGYLDLEFYGSENYELGEEPYNLFYKDTDYSEGSWVEAGNYVEGYEGNEDYLYDGPYYLLSGDEPLEIDVLVSADWNINLNYINDTSYSDNEIFPIELYFNNDPETWSNRYTDKNGNFREQVSTDLTSLTTVLPYDDIKLSEFAPVSTNDFLNAYNSEERYVVNREILITPMYEPAYGDLTVTLEAGSRVHPDDDALFTVEVTGPNGFSETIENFNFGDTKTFTDVLTGTYTAKLVDVNSPYIAEVDVTSGAVTENATTVLELLVDAGWTAIIDYDKTEEAWINDASLSGIGFYFNADKTMDAVTGENGLAAVSTTKALTSITSVENIECHFALDNNFEPITEDDFRNAYASGYVVTRKMFIDTTCAGKMSIKVMNSNKDLGISKNIFFTLYGIDAKGNKTVIQENIKGTTEDNRTANYVIENIDISGNTNYVSYQIVPNVTTYEFNGTQCYLILNHLPELGNPFTVADLRKTHIHGSDECGLHTATQEDEAGNKIEDEIIYVVDEAGKVKVNIEVSDYLDGFVDVNTVKNASTFTVGTVKHESVDFGKALQLEENTHKISLDLGSLIASNYFIEDVKVVTETKNSSTINGDKTVDVDVVKNGSTVITYTIGAKGKINLTLKKGSDALFDPPANTQVEVKLNGVETDYSPVTIEKLGSTNSIPNIDLSKDGTYSFEVITEATTPNYWEEIADVTVTQMKKASSAKFTANRDVVYNSLHYNYSIVINPSTINVKTEEDFTFTVTVTDKRGNGSTTQPILELYWDNEEIGDPISVEFDETTGIAVYTFKAKAPEIIGKYTITGYVNRKDKYYEIDKSDNTATAQVEVKDPETGDLYLNYVPLNTDLRRGEETVVSFIAHNTGSKDVLKEHEVALEATLTYQESYGGANKTISIGDNTEELKAVVIPSVEKGGENLIYVRFTVPENAYSVQYINAKLNMNENSKWKETNESNNTAQIRVYTMFNPGDSSNPGYMEKALSAPNGYVSEIDTPDLTGYDKYSGVDVNGFTITKTVGNKAQWSVWEEQDDKELIARTYSANVYSNPIVKVDNRCLTSKKDGSSVSMKSGYAVTLAVIPNVVTSGSGQRDLKLAVTDCQLATAYFPEVSYNKTEHGKYSILDKIDTASEFNTSQFTSANTSNVGTETHDFPILGNAPRWELPLNTKSNFTAFLQEENASIATQMTRKHFTPLWWKDGAKYEIQTEVSRIWTPSGVIANGGIAKARLTTNTGSSPVDLIINGSVYDDYYTVR